MIKKVPRTPPPPADRQRNHPGSAIQSVLISGQHLLPGVFGSYFVCGILYQVCSQCCIVDELLNGLREVRDEQGFGEQAGLVVGDDIVHTGDVTADDGDAGGHGFDEDHGHAFTDGREDEQADSGERILGPGNGAVESDAGFEIQHANGAVNRQPFGAVTEEVEVNPIAEGCDGPDEVGDHFDGVKPAKETDGVRPWVEGGDGSGGKIGGIDGVGDDDDFVGGYFGAFHRDAGDGGRRDDDFFSGMMNESLHPPMPGGMGLSRLDGLEKSYARAGGFGGGGDAVGMNQETQDGVDVAGANQVDQSADDPQIADAPGTERGDITAGAFELIGDRPPLAKAGDFNVQVRGIVKTKGEFADDRGCAAKFEVGVEEKEAGHSVYDMGRWGEMRNSAAKSQGAQRKTQSGKFG